jgi:hypothetical protein
MAPAASLRGTPNPCVCAGVQVILAVMPTVAVTQAPWEQEGRSPLYAGLDLLRRRHLFSYFDLKNSAG